MNAVDARKSADGAARRPRRRGDDDMMSALDELGDMIRKQQQLRDKTFQQGQDAAARPPAAAQARASSSWASCARISRRCATGSTSCWSR